MKNATVILLGYCSGLFCACNPAYSWSDNATHAAITEKAVQLSAMDDYLKNQLGIQQGLSAEFQTIFYPALEARMADLEPERTIRSALDWVKTGSQLEDKILSTQYRPRHHFHDPIRNAGLDNQADHPEWKKYGPAIWSSYKFDFRGESALYWAINGTSDKIPTENLETWDLARGRFYNAITYATKLDRDRNFAMSLLSLGSTVHLLEDMGVPAHTRNDFLFGHYTNWYSYPWGNDFENWAERTVVSNGGQCPWSGSSPVAFDKLAKYFDADVYSGGYLGDGVLPPNTWGLSECSNYQFLSLSTMFGCSGTKYQFPHPAKENTELNLLLPVSLGNKVYFNGSNYGVSYIARESYTYYFADGMGIYGTEIDNTNTTDDVKVFEDYANITVPRTIEYATGLTNYFFRGRLSATAECVDCNIFELTITNQSSNSGVQQTLKGGIFELYWDDANGNRTPVYDFVVDGWGSSSTLAYGASTTGTFTKPEGEVEGYVLIYKGNICANPADPDPDDSEAIAVCKFQVEIPDGCCYPCNIDCIKVTFTQPGHCTSENENCFDNSAPWCTGDMPLGPFYIKKSDWSSGECPTHCIDVGDGWRIQIFSACEIGMWHECCKEVGALAFWSGNITPNGGWYDNLNQSADNCGGYMNAGANEYYWSGYGGQIKVEISNSTYCQTYTISGYVTVGDVGVAGVTMNGLPNTPVTNANGFYSDTVNGGWNGMVTPTKTDPSPCPDEYSFDPDHRDYTNVTSDQENQDYEMTTIENSYSVPTPITWQITPYETGSSGHCHANMTANVASGCSGTVEYYFECVDNHSINSGWTTNRVWNNVDIGGCGQGLRFHFKARCTEDCASDWSQTWYCFPP